jgi:predicted GIY-YIG superfamily endonuclease
MINVNGYQFEGPYHEASTNFNEVAVVYIILDVNNNPIDVGETDKLKTRLATHERRDCWERNCGKNNIYVAVYKEDSQERRLRVEKEIRNFYRFPCGEE